MTEERFALWDGLPGWRSEAQTPVDPEVARAGYRIVVHFAGPF